jgi:two-component system, response regulator PdtaR
MANASSKLKAIQLLEAHPHISLVFTDVNMPGSMDGVKLAHRVRERWPPVKIIVTSGFKDVTPRAAAEREPFPWQALCA